MDWLDLLAVQGTFKSLLQHHSSKASVLQLGHYKILHQFLTWIFKQGQTLSDLVKVIEAEKAMAPHSSTLARKIPWMEGPGRLQSMGSLGVGYD